MRETHEAKPKPLSANDHMTALRARRVLVTEMAPRLEGGGQIVPGQIVPDQIVSGASPGRTPRVPGGIAWSQDWKPTSDAGLIASSTMPVRVSQVTTTWSE